MKKWFVYALCLVIIGSLAGCQKTQRTRGSQIGHNEEISSAEDNRIMLTAYYVDSPESPGAKAFIEWYQYLDDEAVGVEAVGFPSAKEMQEKINQDGLPDLVFLEKSSAALAVNPFQWIQEGMAASISEPMEQDASFDAGEYIAGVLEAGKVDGQQYILPLSVETQYLIVEEGKKSASALDQLPSSYTLEDLYYALESDREEHRRESAFCPTMPYHLQISNGEQWLCDFLQQTGALHIDRNLQTVTVDEEIFHQMMPCFRGQYQDYQRAAEEMKVDDMGFITRQNSSTAFVSNENPIIMTRVCASAYSELLDQQMTVIPFPKAGENKTYALNVNVMGMVGADSEYQKEAYQVLRTMMDIPAKNWELITNRDPLVKVCPVRLATAQQVVERYSEIEGGIYLVEGDTVEKGVTRIPLSKEQATILGEVFEKTQDAYIVDSATCRAIGDYVYPYLNGETDDLSGLAQTLQEEIQNNLS